MFVVDSEQLIKIELFDQHKHVC